MKKIFFIFLILTTFIYANDCFNQGAVMGDNHELIKFKCAKKYQFEATNGALSRLFTQKEVNKIMKIYKTANKNYKTFYDRKVLYKTKGLKIWVRLYSSSRWFIVFDMKGTTPYPDSSEASVWIEDKKFKEFVLLLKDKKVKTKAKPKKIVKYTPPSPEVANKQYKDAVKRYKTAVSFNVEQEAKCNLSKYVLEKAKHQTLEKDAVKVWTSINYGACKLVN